MLPNNQKGIGGIAIKMLTELSKNNCLTKDLVCPECGRKSVDYIYVGNPSTHILYACDTGKNKNGFAQQLADNFGVMVEAPNRKLFPTIKGEFIIADKISWSKNTYIRGSWVQYKPKKYF